MADWYPDASRDTYPEDSSRRYDTSYPWRGVLHSTEGTSWPTYANSAPHFTLDPRNGSVRQHYRISYPAMSLKSAPDVATNKARCIQIEIIGTCDPARRGDAGWLFLPELLADELVGLAGLMRWVEAQTGIPAASGLTWLEYPASYGDSPVRLSSSAWRTFTGWAGHQHVTGNDHGDPGDLDIAGLLGKADEEMGDVTLVGVSNDAAQVLSKAVWERYGTAADIEAMRNDIAEIKRLLGQAQ